MNLGRWMLVSLVVFVYGCARVKLVYVGEQPGSPQDHSSVEGFNGKLRNELLDRKFFDTLLEAKVLIGRWRTASNTIRPHRSPGCRPPVPESRRPVSAWQFYSGDRHWFHSWE